MAQHEVPNQLDTKAPDNQHSTHKTCKISHMQSTHKRAHTLTLRLPAAAASNSKIVDTGMKLEAQVSTPVAISSLVILGMYLAQFGNIAMLVAKGIREGNAQARSFWSQEDRVLRRKSCAYELNAQIEAAHWLIQWS